MKKLLLCLALVLCAGIASAGPIHYNAFDGGWLPSGSKALMGYIGNYGADNYYQKGDKAYENVDFNVNVGILRFSAWQTVGVPWQMHIVVPFGRKHIEMAGNSQTASGFSDPEFDLAFMPYRWKDGTMGLGLAVTAPVGTYNPNQFSMGDNRWMFRPMLNIGQNLGRWHFDWWLCGEYYTDNTNYRLNRGRPTQQKATLEKEIAFFSELHASYFIVPDSRTAVSVSVGGMWGGKEKAKDQTVATAMDDYAVKVGFSTMITQTVALNYTLTYDLAVENGPAGYQNMIRMTKYF